MFSSEGPKIRRVLFANKPRQRRKHPNIGTRDEFFFKIRRKQWFERSWEKGKLLPKTAGILNFFIFARPLIYESFLL